MSALGYCLSKSTLSGPISALCEKYNPPVSEGRDSEISVICLWLYFSLASIWNQNPSKSTDSLIRLTFSFLLAVCSFSLVGCGGSAKLSRNLLLDLPPGASVAVSYIHEEETGDITLLGNHLRDRVEAVLADRELVVKARKDIAFLIEDAEVTDVLAEERIWEQAGADVLIRGTYSLGTRSKVGAKGYKEPIRLLLKAYGVDSTSLLDSEELVLEMDWNRIQPLLKTRGNIYQQEFATVMGGEADAPVKLHATLNKQSGCYRPGESVSVDIECEKDVWLYIFSLSCDSNVVLLYPPPWLDEKPLESERLLFPSPKISRIQALRVQPAEEGVVCHESFKLVASREKLDFSFLPFPGNAIYTGLNGERIREVNGLVNGVTGSGQLVLDYRVDQKCR